MPILSEVRIIHSWIKNLHLVSVDHESLLVGQLEPVACLDLICMYAGYKFYQVTSARFYKNMLIVYAVIVIHLLVARDWNWIFWR